MQGLGSGLHYEEYSKMATPVATSVATSVATPAPTIPSSTYAEESSSKPDAVVVVRSNPNPILRLFDDPVRVQNVLLFILIVVLFNIGCFLKQLVFEFRRSTRRRRSRRR